jgi:hypothetical protein
MAEEMLLKQTDHSWDSSWTFLIPEP